MVPGVPILHDPFRWSITTSTSSGANLDVVLAADATSILTQGAYERTPFLE